MPSYSVIPLDRPFGRAHAARAPFLCTTVAQRSVRHVVHRRIRVLIFCCLPLAAYRLKADINIALRFQNCDTLAT